jgi:hypothetical protein
MRHMSFGWFLKKILWAIFFLCIGYTILVLLFRPSHDRNWELGHEQLPRLTQVADSTLVTIENYRNFTWTTATTAEPVYETLEVDLEKITGVDVFVSHFDDFEGLAHIFLSFGFATGEQVVISVETRREADETFSPLLGLLRQFEIVYVVGSEADLVGVRTEHRGERVYLYPTTATAEQARELFEEFMIAINGVYETPRMYNTLTHNCTNELTRPVRRMSEVDFPLTWKGIFPGYFVEVLYELELIDTSQSFASVKYAHRLDAASLDPQSPSFSTDLRRSISAGSEE